MGHILLYRGGPGVLAPGEFPGAGYGSLPTRRSSSAEFGKHLRIANGKQCLIKGKKGSKP